MQTVLITEGDEQTRKEKALKMAVSHKTSKEDITLLKPNNSTSIIRINEVRELKRKLILKPFNSPSKLAIIHQVNQASLEAQNALLKILEEPPNQTYIILTAPRAEDLLPTIVSRCQIIKIKNIEIAKLGNGEIESNLQLLISIFQSGVGERLVLAQKISSSREEAINWCRKMISTLRYVLIHKIRSTKHEIRNKSEILNSNDQNKTVLNLENLDFEHYFGFRISDFGFIIKKLQKALFALEKTNTNPRLLMENLLLKFPQSLKIILPHTT